MGKTLIYILLLAILGAGVYYFVFNNQDKTFSDKEAGFAVKDTASIHQIFLVRTSGESIDLQRTDSGWVLNGKYMTRPGVVANLLNTIRRLEAKYPVPEQAHNGIVKTLAGNSIKAELFDASGKNIRTFYVGNEAYEFKGTYMLLEGAKRPFVVQIPNFTGVLTPFFTTSLDDWRSRSIFNIAPDDIREAKVEYPLNPVNSFTIQQNGAIKMVADPKVSSGKPLNEQRVKSFLKFFTNVNCEGYLNGIPGIDSSMSGMPNFCNISVTNKQGKQQLLKVFFMPINKRSKNRTVPEPEKYDQDRYYAVFNGDRDTMVVQHHTFGKMFRGAPEFYVADEPMEVTLPKAQ